MKSAEDGINLRVRRLVDQIHANAADFDETYAMIKELLRPFATDDRASAVSLSNYGGALSDTGSHEAAIPILERAVASEPDFSQAYFNLGVVFMNTQRLDDGAELIRKSHKFPKNDMAFDAYFDPMAH